MLAQTYAHSSQNLKEKRHDFSSYFTKVNEASSWLKANIPSSPKVIISLTGAIEIPSNMISEQISIKSSEIPHFPTAMAEGHSGELIFGKMKGKDIVVLQGRYHYYEGLSPQRVVFPYFVLKEIGARYLITCNAAGGINYNFCPGNIMLIEDHINHMGNNPLIGIAIQKKEKQFTNMTKAYDPFLQNLAKENAKKLEIELKKGVYLATSGPNYESKSEIKAFRTWGADAVGMSTAFEVIACNFLEIKVLAFSGITNLAADIHEGEMKHKEVLEAMKIMKPKLSSLIVKCTEEILNL